MLIKADKYIALTLGCMLTLSACSSDEELSIPDNQSKTTIDLAAGISDDAPSITRGVTRSVVTTDNTGSKPLELGTSIYMVLKSEDKENTLAAPMFTRTIAYAEGSTSGNNKLKFNTQYGRFWEDSYSRNSQLSAYAICVPNYYLEASVHEQAVKSGWVDNTKWEINNSDNYDNTWNETNGATTIEWPLRTTPVAQQTTDFVSSQDICFSNNVSAVGDGRVAFDETHKKFGSGLMTFYHALTRVTFKIKKGEGFEKDEKFEFSEAGQNIVLKKFLANGTFDIEQGEFITSSEADINELAVAATKTTDGYEYVLDGLMLPGTNLMDIEIGTVSFIINNNLYQLTKQTLYNALVKKAEEEGKPLRLNEGKMLAGVHYVFTMTVGKKKMDSFTAAVVDWETVNADVVEPSNARITMTLLDKGVQKKGAADFDLFRAGNYNDGAIDDDFTRYDWQTGYTPVENKAQLVEAIVNSGIYAAEEAQDPHTAWYWPDNKTFYHFRTVMPKTDDTWKVESAGNSDDYISLTADFADSYRDVCWGAPFETTSSKLTYDSDSRGFDGKGSNHQLSKAIGPTKSTVNMIMFHMMSDVTINLTTTEGADKVDLTNAKMDLNNIHTTGKVLMGNGLVIADNGTTTVSNEKMAGSNETPWHYGFVPQSLENVELTITTADNNLYIVNMEDVLATTVGDNIISNPYTKSGAKYVINRWLPNYQYTYTFKLTKAGITKITASLAAWETVEAGDDNVQIR